MILFPGLTREPGAKKSGHQPQFKKIRKHKIALSCLEPNPKADGADGIFV